MDDRSFTAAQDVILDIKRHWTTRLYPALKAEYRARAEASGAEPQDVAGVADLVADTPLYRGYAWLERHLQRMKYSGRYGLVPYHAERQAALAAQVAAVPADARAETDPDLAFPKYYTAVDIHQHPGGVWRDPFAAFVYERGARSTTPMLGTRHRDLHGRFTDLVAAGGPAPARILDMGCGFGKSTGPFWEAFRAAEVHGIDLSAPCVELAAADAAAAQARHVRFRQMDACTTDYPDGSFDLVTSTMLLHEMPPREIGRLLDEAKRLLAPGGRMVHLDFWLLPDAFARFIHYGHARRNNEPFMPPFAEMDVAAELQARGFRNVAVEPFAEAEGVDTADSPTWRFPWTVIAGAAPTA
ncbi:MAG: class I SAM-dependent methyltransferase [Sneathiellaceae bacterium]